MTANAPTLAAMSVELSRQAAGNTSAQLVEKLLYALRVEDYDAMAGALDVGPSRRNADVDVKIHSVPSKAPRC